MADPYLSGDLDEDELERLRREAILAAEARTPQLPRYTGAGVATPDERFELPTRSPSPTVAAPYDRGSESDAATTAPGRSVHRYQPFDPKFGDYLRAALSGIAGGTGIAGQREVHDKEQQARAKEAAQDAEYARWLADRQSTERERTADRSARMAERSSAEAVAMDQRAAEQAKQEAVLKEGRTYAEQQTLGREARAAAEHDRRYGKRGGSSGGGVQGPDTVDDAQAGLAEHYGGEEQIPIDKVRQLQAIRAMPPKQRGAAVARVWADIGSRREETEVRDDREIQRQTEGYGNELAQRRTSQARAALERVHEVLKDAVGKDNDIAGYGQTRWVPDVMVSQAGENLRVAVAKLRDSELREATGAAAPTDEKATFAYLLGDQNVKSDADLINALEQVAARIKSAEDDARKMYPLARQHAQRGQRARSAPGGERAAPRPSKEIPTAQVEEMYE